MAIDQVRQKSHLQQQKKKSMKWKTASCIILGACKWPAYQVNSFIVQVVFQCLLELPDHGLHKLAAKIVISGIQ